jgi:dCTP deaminase
MTIQSDHWIRRQCEPPVVRSMLRDEVPDTMTLRDVLRLGYPSVERFLSSYDYKSWALITPLDYDSLNLSAFKPMIEPFEPGQVSSRPRTVQGEGIEVPGGMQYNDEIVHDRVMSYGTSSYGYDVRVADEFKIFTNINTTVIDPKNFGDNNFVEVTGGERGYIVIPPNSFALGRTVEHFRIPRNILTICLGKSTYARCGIIVNVTPLEPEWEGYVTLEFSNTTPLPAKLYANEGCAQMLFFEGNEPCDVSYADRGGKYQGQTGVVVPRMKG